MPERINGATWSAYRAAYTELKRVSKYGPIRTDQMSDFDGGNDGQRDARRPLTCVRARVCASACVNVCVACEIMIQPYIVTRLICGPIALLLFFEALNRVVYFFQVFRPKKEKKKKKKEYQKKNYPRFGRI